MPIIISQCWGGGISVNFELQAIWQFKLSEIFSELWENLWNTREKFFKKHFEHCKGSDQIDKFYNESLLVN